MSTARSTTHMSDESRRVSVQMGQVGFSVNAPQVAQNWIFSRAWSITSASCFTTAESVWTRCSAMRSAERGPMPGSLFSAAMSETTGSGIGFIVPFVLVIVLVIEKSRTRTRTRTIKNLRQSRQVQSRRDFAHFGVGNFLGLAECLVRGGHDHVFEQLCARRIGRLRLNFHRGNGRVSLGGKFDRAAAAGGLDGARSDLRLHLFHLLLHSRSLFHEFAEMGKI